ncbi:MAG: MATE family efflux transporter [Gammaproteobacteria bacterium]|nr:MATE family efflux transporter [Gammaproteobacteria bacterium]
MTTNKSLHLTTEMKHLLILALPLMLSEVVDASFSFTATLLSARLGIIELAAGGLVTTLFITIMIFMWGILVAVSTLVSQRHGAKDHAGISRVLKDALILATLFSIPGMLLVWNMSPILLFFGQKPETIEIAKHYLHALTWAVFPDFWAVVLLQFVIGLGKTRLALLFNAVKVPVTLLISYIFMNGKFGMPKLGIAGLGWGISTGMWIATLLLLSYIIFNADLRHYLFKESKTKKHYIFEILRTGLPIAGMFCIEVGYFTVMALVMGRIGSLVLAANQVVTQFTGFFTVVIAFAYAQAVSIKVGHAVGRREIHATPKITYGGLIVAVGLMTIVAFFYWFMPQHLIGIDLDPHHSKNIMITHYATQFMFVAGFVQIFESARIVLFGALRGLGETHFSMMTSLVIFWLIAFPIGLLLTFVMGLGGIGMWIGMAIGTLTGAILLFWWLHRALRIRKWL